MATNNRTTSRFSPVVDTLHSAETWLHGQPLRFREWSIKQRDRATQRAHEEQARTRTIDTEVRPLRVRILRGLPAISIWGVVLLVGLRAFLPQVEEHLPAVYDFLDQVVLPLVNWIFNLAVRAWQKLQGENWFMRIVEGINDFFDAILN